MKHLKNIGFFVLIFLCSSQSFAFDGNRKGFTMGLGAGYAPYANPDMQSFSDDFSFSGFGMNFMIGYNWNSKNLITWEMLGALNVSEYSKDDAGLIGINGIIWYHYLKDTPKSFYSILGAGRVVSVSVRYDGDNRSFGYVTTNVGFVIGGGYEFMKQLQFSTYYVRGKSSEFSFDINQNMIYASVSFLAY